MKSATLRLVATVMTAILVAGCVPRSAITIIKSYPKRPKGYPIFITAGDVEEPYEVLATVRTPSFEDYEAQELGEDHLCGWARRIGGDAVIQVKREPLVKERLGYHPTGTFRAGTTLVTSYYYTGTVVRFTRASPSDALGPATPE